MRDRFLLCGFMLVFLCAPAFARAEAGSECKLDSDCSLVFGSCDCLAVARGRVAEARASLAKDPRQCKCNSCDCGVSEYAAACRRGKCVKRALTGGNAELAPDDIDSCASASDCVLVAFRHCCGATKKAIHKKYEADYRKFPAWRKFDDPKVCAMIGVCRGDSGVKRAACVENRCVLDWTGVD